MKAVSFDLSIPRYLLGKSLGGVTTAVTHGGLSGLSLRDLPEPVLPGPDWVRLEVMAAGICGTDLSTLAFHTSPLMEPFGSFPAVLGHEVLGRVVEVGAQVEAIEVGQRIVVDPMLSCGIRGISAEAACTSCKAGQPSTCSQAGESGPLEVNGEPLAPGVTIGYHRHLPGGWGEQMVVHRSQVHPVPDGLEDNAAVLVEPLSIGLHAALGSPPSRPDPVLVIGSGPIAMGAVWAIRAMGFEGTLIAQAKRFKEGHLALALGATEVVKPGAGAREALIDTGAKAYRPIVGDEVYAGGGFPLIYDCVGSRESLEQALRYAAPRGRIVMLGCAAQLRKVDLTFLWARELEVVGYLGYGTERWRGGEHHTFEITLELLQESSAPVTRLVTHLYPLSQYQDALRAASNRRASGAMKVILTPGK